MSNMLRINCLVFGDSRNHIFTVEVPDTENISGLKDAIKEKKKLTFQHLDADALDLWEVPLLNDESLNEKLKNLILDPDQLLSPTDYVLDVFSDSPPRKYLHLVVKPPTVGNGGIETQPVQQTSKLQHYQRFFIDVGKWGAFSKSDIDLNKIQDARSAPVPDFVEKFERKLVSKPGLAPDVSSFFTLSHEWFHEHSESWGTYFDHGSSIPHDMLLEDLIAEDREQPWRSAGAIEASHIVDLVRIDWRCFWDKPFGKALTGHVADAVFFYKLLANSLKDSDEMPKMPTARLGTFSWPFDLVMKCANQPVTDQHRIYRPHSDLLICMSGLPRLLVEVNSTQTPEWPPDLTRMLLQGAAVVHFANEFLGAEEFVLAVFFIYPQGKVTRYTLFKGDGKINYRTKDFSLNEPIGRLEFARQLYNGIYMLEGEENEETKAKISKFKDKLNEHQQDSPMKSFFTKDDDKDNQGAGGSGAADHAVLRAHGYEVKPDVILDADGIAWKPLFKRPSHILTVHRSSDPSKELVAKKVRVESNELEILRILDTAHPKSEHVISLFDAFYTHPGQWVILPQMDTVANYLMIAPSKLYDSVAQICWGLIKGLAYLHMHRIAHRDIKPDNLVVDKDFCLKIIDFDVAVQVKDEDEEVNGYCGTKYWIAPEVEKAPLMYSPIKADRWSCGHVILYLLDELGKEDNPLRAIGRKLKAESPKQRPSLLMWRIWDSAPLQNVPDVGKVGERRPRQDTIEADEESTNSPKAKKQRLTVLDQS